MEMGKQQNLFPIAGSREGDEEDEDAVHPRVGGDVVSDLWTFGQI